MPEFRGARPVTGRDVIYMENENPGSGDQFNLIDGVINFLTHCRKSGCHIP